MAHYCQENAEWNKRVWRMRNLTLRCGLCGQAYKEYQNVGTWTCPAFQVWDHARGRMISVPADHGGPFTTLQSERPALPATVASVPSYVEPWLEGTRADAVLERAETRGAGTRGTISIYETVQISRVDQKKYAETQHKIYIEPPRTKVLDGYGILR